MKKNKVLILRNFASKANVSSYNLQEVGLGKAFVNSGYNCDVIYYSDENFDETIYKKKEKILVIKWTKAMKFMSNSVYFSILNKRVLNQYDLIITTEYNQIMTLFLSLLAKDKIYLYHGPYRDNGNKLMQFLYDKIITPVIKKRLTKVFVKSDLANEYLKTKGFQNMVTIGVGLDTEPLNTSVYQYEGNLIIDSNKKNLLYVGVLEERRNICFLLKMFAKLVLKYPAIHLTLVGKGKEEDTERYFRLIKELGICANITHINEIPQSELKFLYQKMDLFLFPTSYDIFGMVLLESMYFKLPVVSTRNGGSETLIDENSGVVLNELDENQWIETIYSLLENKEMRKEMGENARLRVSKEFSWESIIRKIIL